jgi:hypothetical protein
MRPTLHARRLTESPEMRGDGPVIPFSVIWLAIVSSMW